MTCFVFSCERCEASIAVKVPDASAAKYLPVWKRGDSGPVLTPIGRLVLGGMAPLSVHDLEFPTVTGLCPRCRMFFVVSVDGTEVS